MTRDSMLSLYRIGTHWQCSRAGCGTPIFIAYECVRCIHYLMIITVVVAVVAQAPFNPPEMISSMLSECNLNCTICRCDIFIWFYHSTQFHTFVIMSKEIDTNLEEEKIAVDWWARSIFTVINGRLNFRFVSIWKEEWCDRLDYKCQQIYNANDDVQSRCSILLCDWLPHRKWNHHRFCVDARNTQNT